MMKLPQQQSGAALIMGLVLLMVLSMLGLSSMRQATLEERIASNTQNQYEVFTAAESQVQNGLNDADILTNLYNSGSDSTQQVSNYEDQVVDNNITASTTFTWDSSGAPIDVSGAGSELGTYHAENIWVTGTASLDGTGVSSTQSALITIIGLNTGAL